MTAPGTELLKGSGRASPLDAGNADTGRLGDVPWADLRRGCDHGIVGEPTGGIGTESGDFRLGVYGWSRCISGLDPMQSATDPHYGR